MLLAICTVPPVVADFQKGRHERLPIFVVAQQSRAKRIVEVGDAEPGQDVVAGFGVGFPFSTMARVSPERGEMRPVGEAVAAVAAGEEQRALA